MSPASSSIHATASDDANLAPTIAHMPMPDRRITFMRAAARARAPVGGRCEERGRESGRGGGGIGAVVVRWLVGITRARAFQAARIAPLLPGGTAE